MISAVETCSDASVQSVMELCHITIETTNHPDTRAQPQGPGASSFLASPAPPCLPSCLPLANNLPPKMSWSQAALSQIIPS